MRRCELCGAAGAERGLVRYREGDRWRFEAIDRCTDHDRCRARCEAGELVYWPVDHIDPRQTANLA